MASIWPTAWAWPSSMPMPRRCSIAAVLRKTLSIDMRVPLGDLVDSDATETRPLLWQYVASGERGQVGVRRAVGVREAVAEHEPMRSVGLEHPRSRAAGRPRPGHVVLDEAAGRQVVLR